jgi:hypothetical protein
MSAAPSQAAVVCHSDRGSQYVSIRYTERLAEAGIEPSVGGSYDNALAETVIGLFKTEVIHRRSPRRSFEAVEFATLDWVDWFNHSQLLEPIGNVPPAEAEARYYAQTEAQAWAAEPKPNGLREFRCGSVPLPAADWLTVASRRAQGAAPYRGS